MDFPKHTSLPHGATIVVNSAEEERAVLDGTAIVEETVAAKENGGNTYKIIGIRHKGDK